MKIQNKNYVKFYGNEKNFGFPIVFYFKLELLIK